MDKTDVKTPNPCILTQEEQNKLLLLLKKSNLKLGTTNLPTAPAGITPITYPITLKQGGTGKDLSLTGGTSKAVLQESAGTAFSVRQITDADLSLSDITTNNVLSTLHGFAPKSPADATKYLNGATVPAYATVKDSDLSTSDITTNDVSISKHGFTPKAPNDNTKFLRGDASWAVPLDALPIVRAYGSALSQNGAVASIVSYTTGSSGGAFEIGGYIDVTAFTAGTISLLCDYTDPSGNAKTLTIPLVALAGTIGTTVGSLTDAQALICSLQTSGANSIKIYTTITAFTGTYNVYAWIKQIN